MLQYQHYLLSLLSRLPKQFVETNIAFVIKHQRQELFPHE
jgi:hypothetical protein